MKLIKLLSQRDIIKKINRNTKVSYQLFDQLIAERPPVFSSDDHHDSDHIERRLRERGENNDY